MHFCPKQAHSIHVRLLPADIFLAHKDFAFHIEKGASGCRCHTMLTGAGFSDDFGFAHAPCKQCLTKNIVDLVRAGVVQLVTLEVKLCSTKMFGQPLGKIKRAWPPHIMRLVIGKFLGKGIVLTCRLV